MSGDGCASPELIRASFMGSFQAQSAPGDIDHLKITGGKGIVGAEIVGKHYGVTRG
jgi:hypothetical protein